MYRKLQRFTVECLSDLADALPTANGQDRIDTDEGSALDRQRVYQASSHHECRSIQWAVPSPFGAVMVRLCAVDSINILIMTLLLHRLCDISAWSFHNGLGLSASKHTRTIAGLPADWCDGGLLPTVLHLLTPYGINLSAADPGDGWTVRPWWSRLDYSSCPPCPCSSWPGSDSVTFVWIDDGRASPKDRPIRA